MDCSAALLARLEADLELNHQLSLPAYEVLLSLADAPERRLRLQVLVDRARLTKSGVSRLVDRMESEGLIETQSCPSDKRGAFAVLTEAGEERIKRASADQNRTLDELFSSHLDRQEATVLTDVLRRVLNSLPAQAKRCGAAAGLREAETPPLAPAKQ